MADVELTVIIFDVRQRGDSLPLLGPIQRIAAELASDRHEIIAVRPSGSTPRGEKQCMTLEASSTLHGDALREAFGAARGRFIATLDGDLSHPPELLREMWAARLDADIIIASRYVPGGRARLPITRRALSRALNLWYSRALSLPIHDFSSGYRLYRSAILRSIPATKSRGYAVLPEILVRAYADGWALKEIPFTHSVSRSVPSAWLARLAFELVTSFYRLWKLRWSIHCADYDFRAFTSRIWLQRYWHRCRHRFSLGFAGEGFTLDAGCGSSRILVDLRHAIGLDLSLSKLRYMRRYRKPLVCGSVTALPFKSGAFEVALCSQVIEHLPQPDSELALRELIRVLKQGGRIVIGTPDYGRLAWRLTERAYQLAAPWGYADEHVTRYTRQSLVERLTALGIALEDERYILRGELILAGRKVTSPSELASSSAAVRAQSPQ